MSNIFNIAEYILKQCGHISDMKLQKLCYYAQAWSLVWDGRPLFEEDFQAWNSGPVCPELYYKSYKKDEDKDLSNHQKNTIDRVLEYYGKQSDQWLSQLTLEEEPWIKAKNKGIGSIITKKEIRTYYQKLYNNL